MSSSDLFHLDVTGANGTPFRFIAWPEENAIRYYDRRYTLAEGEPGYGVNHMNEDGQACGPAMILKGFEGTRWIRGWHDVSAWDVDAATMQLVGVWVTHVLKMHTSKRES